MAPPAADREPPSPDDAQQRWRRRFAGARVAVLVTIRPDGAPHAVPFTFAVTGDTIYSAVDDKPKRTTELQRLANLAAHPAAAALAQHYDDDWQRLWWVRADGTGRVVSDAEERARALAGLVARYSPYRAAPPAGRVIALDVARWSGWEAAALSR